MLTGTDTPERIRGASVSPNFFDTLGLTAVRGRTFLATDARPDADPTVVVSEAYWRRRGADPGLVGTEVTLQDRRRFIVGVVSHAAALSYVSHATDSPVGRIDIWEPVAWVDTSYDRSPHFLRVIGTAPGGIARDRCSWRLKWPHRSSYWWRPDCSCAASRSSRR